jgi:hypothetical protein
MKKKDLIKFMGGRVTVTARSFRVVEDGKASWVSQSISEPFVGWVCGFVRAYDGSIEHEPRDSEFQYFSRGGNGYNVWRPTEGHVFALVRRDPMGAAFHVPLEGMTLTDDPVTPDAQCEWADSDREEARRYMADWPRDERGRWLKKPADFEPAHKITWALNKPIDPDDEFVKYLLEKGEARPLGVEVKK